MNDAGRVVPVLTKIPKPLPGAPCNGCGGCCLATKCPLAIGLFGPEPEGPCPALEWTGERAVCGLVVNPARYTEGAAGGHSPDSLSKAARFVVGVGTGCDSRVVGDPKFPPEFLERQRHMQNLGRMVSGFVAWLGYARARGAHPGYGKVKEERAMADKSKIEWTRPSVHAINRHGTDQRRRAQNRRETREYKR